MIDSGAGDIGPVVDVARFVNRPAMNAHAQLQVRTLFESLRDFQRALHRPFQTVPKNEGHPVAQRKTDQFAARFGRLHLGRALDDLTERLLQLALFVDEQFRVTDNVHEQDMPDFQMGFGAGFNSHIVAEEYLRFDFGNRKTLIICRCRN